MADLAYIAIDLKSFYASVECVERGLDPLDAYLVLADESRTAKTICLAVSPSLKAYGISGRARLFEVIQETQRINNGRRYKAPHRTFSGKSYLDSKLKADPSLELDYVVAPPRMAYYIEYSTKIYEIYLKYIAPEDICVYSIDEVFIDATHYLKTYKMTAHELAMTIIQDVLKETGITATAGIGTNLYLAKVAMDVEAKHIKPDKDGVRIAELDEMKYRRSLWTHRPITDFWRVGKGYAKKLEKYYMYTMGDVARCSINDEEILYRMFGVNAELLIDHAWGWEPCTMADIRAYKPETNSISSGQVLQEPYPNDKARLVVREMAEALSLDLVGKKKVTDQIVLTIGYDIENVGKTDIKYKGEITVDRYGRKTPKHAHGTGNIGRYTASTKLIINTALDLFDRITDQKLTVRRITIVANHVIDENDVPKSEAYEQLGMFTDYDELERNTYLVTTHHVCVAGLRYFLCSGIEQHSGNHVGNQRDYRTLCYGKTDISRSALIKTCLCGPTKRVWRCADMKDSERKISVCPKCGRTYTDRPALSRTDNETLIFPTAERVRRLKA